MPAKNNLVNSRKIFQITILVIVLTTLIVWLTGLSQNRTFHKNLFLINIILASTFFLFLCINLYQGIKIQDSFGDIRKKNKPLSIKKITEYLPNIFDFAGDGIDSFIISVLLWILVSIILVVFIWLFGSVIWTLLLWLIALLYWIFFRALRLVFKNSNTCRGNLGRSIIFSLTYTLMYIFWFNVLIEFIYIVS